MGRLIVSCMGCHTKLIDETWAGKKSVIQIFMLVTHVGHNRALMEKHIKECRIPHPTGIPPDDTVAMGITIGQ